MEDLADSISVIGRSLKSPEITIIQYRRRHYHIFL